MTHEKMPEALRLAEMIKRYNAGVHSQAIAEDYAAAACELERQHAEIERLRNAMKVARMSSGYHMMHPDTQAIIDAALQSTKEQP